MKTDKRKKANKANKIDKKKALLITEVTVLVLFIAMFIFCLVIELAAPETSVAKWVRDNIWNIKETFANIQNHVPILISSLIYIILTYAICKLLRLFFKRQMEKGNRKKSIYALIDGFVKYACAIIIIILVLRALGVNTTALLASVGVLTLVVGLGAQPLIADIIAGIFIIFENEYNVGEIVAINGFRGTVTEIGIRSTKVLDAAGNIKIINNNDVSDVVNLSRELSLAVVECDFPYDVPLEKVENLLSKNFDKMKEHIPAIVEGPYYLGVSQYKDSNVTIKIVANCKEEDRFQVERDMLREYRIILTDNDIDIAYPHVVVGYHEEKEDKKISSYTKKKANEFVEEQKIESHNKDEQQQV